MKHRYHIIIAIIATWIAYTIGELWYLSQPQFLIEHLSIHYTNGCIQDVNTLICSNGALP